MSEEPEAPEDPIQIKLTRAEALVLFEWLYTFDETDLGPPMDSAERSALWRLEGKLERRLIELFAPNFSELLEDARKKVLNMGPGGGDD